MEALAQSARDIIARAYPRLGSKMLFVYDYGDEWRFRVELIGRGGLRQASLIPVIARLGKAPEQYPGTMWLTQLPAEPRPTQPARAAASTLTEAGARADITRR